MFELKLTLRIFTLVFLGVALSFLLVGRKQYNDKRVSAISISVTPSLEAVTQPQFQTEKMDSPDGSKTLVMEKQTGQGKSNYSFFTMDADGDNEIEIFVKDVDYNSLLEIPYNTWSPDNAYFFLKETNRGSTDYLVFFSSGENFADGQQYLYIKNLFLSKYPEFKIEDITGWAAVNLLLVNVKSQTGEKVSFWFDVTSQNFTRLGTYFQ